VAGNRSVSHLVRRSLDSLDDEEQDAAIWASKQLVKVDGEFARATIGHVVKMLSDSSIPLHFHGRLIDILGASHSTAADSAFLCLSHHLKGRCNILARKIHRNSLFQIHNTLYSD
jgi:hypothetical protein